MSSKKVTKAKKENVEKAENTKYVDLLDEDKPIAGQKFYCVSFVSPEYHIKNRELNYGNRVKINEWDKKESRLEKDIEAQQKELPPPNKRHSIMLPNEDLDNWDDEL